MIEEPSVKRTYIGVEDLAEADCWAHMAFSIDLPDETLKKRFQSFSARADRMLLDDMKDNKNPRVQEICRMLEKIIYEKEHPPIIQYAIIAAERDAVDMLDGNSAAHRDLIKCDGTELLSRFMYNVRDFLPDSNRRLVWDIYKTSIFGHSSNDQKLATIVKNAGSFNYELHVQDSSLKDLGIKKIYCALVRE